MEIPSRSWIKLGADLFFQGGNWYLLIADCYSEFPNVLSFLSLTSKDVISAGIPSISVFGILDETISDNGSQFMAKEYHELADRYAFKITTSSPHYLRGYGFIERQVQTMC